MDPAEIAFKAESLRGEARKIPDPSMMNYKKVLESYRRVLNDILVLIREMARHTHDIVLDQETKTPKK